MQQDNLDELFSKYERWILRPLQENVLNQGRSHFNIFIVLSAVIDNLASIRFLGEIKNGQKHAVGKRYTKFIREYMPRYRSLDTKLYKGFRCRLVHEFQLDHFDIRQDAASVAKHLQEVQGGKICLNSSELLKDVVAAFHNLKSEMVGPTAKQEIVQSFITSGYKSWVHTEWVEA